MHCMLQKFHEYLSTWPELCRGVECRFINRLLITFPFFVEILDCGTRGTEVRNGWFCEYMGHDVSNMRGFDSYRLLTLSLAALMTRISSVVIEGAHTSAGAATLARTVPFWGRFRSPREPTAGPCRGCLLPSATNTAPSRHHLQAVLCDGWDVQTPPSWLLRPQTRELYGWS